MYRQFHLAHLSCPADLLTAMPMHAAFGKCLPGLMLVCAYVRTSSYSLARYAPLYSQAMEHLRQLLTVAAHKEALRVLDVFQGLAK